jgi:quercetin dioxygenase-like cupin family protein
VGYKIVDPASPTAGRGPHPAASPFDKRVSAELGISAFEVYQVELPPRVETVRHHHLDDQGEDLYDVLRGDGWVMVDQEQVPVRPGQFIAVTIESARQVRAGDEGMVFIALCAAPH